MLAQSEPALKTLQQNRQSHASVRPRLTVVSPTFNEVDNVERLVAELSRSLEGIEHEILIVDDDSPDLTWKRVEQIGQSDPRVRVLRRIENRGLGASVIDGFSAARAEVVACIDSDLQHDPEILAAMLAEVEQGADMAVGCRYMEGGGTGDWNWIRRLESKIATKMAQWAIRVKLRDPMSGYFMMRRRDFLRVREQLNGDGFKILLEIVANLQPKQVTEVPYTFRPRTKGESKLSGKVVLAYLKQLARLRGKGLPVRFLKFSLVGATGIVLNLATMTLIVFEFGIKDWRASALASLVAMVSNYVLNNAWTFRDRARTGASLISGYFSYVVASLVGLGVTTGIFSALTEIFHRLLVRVTSNIGLLVCQLFAILVGSYFNYKLNKVLTWRRPPALAVD